jgi:hypothetical protein
VVFKIPRAWPVFVLDDSDERIVWFKKRIPWAIFAKTSTEALEILRNGQFKIVFLDHDLSFMDAGFPNRQHRNGKEVARFLLIWKFSGIVVIHSLNPDGARAMKTYLTNAQLTPFGTFDVEVT